MTVAAPKSRRGWFALVLAAVIAVTGALMWANTAQATLPTVDVVFDDDVTATSVAPGHSFNYTATLTVTGTAAETEPVTFTVDLDDNLTVGTIAVSGTLFAAPDCSVGVNNVVTCTDSDGLAENHSSGTITIPVMAPGSGTIAAPTSCSYDDADTGTGPVACTVNAGSLTVDTSLAATVSPASADNLVGTTHTITFTLAPNVNCASGDLNAGDAPGNVSCTIADVNLTSGGTVTVQSVAVTGDASIGTSTTVEVTIASDGTGADSAHVSLDLIANDGDGDPNNDVAFTSPEATKNFNDVAGNAWLWHFDDPDKAIENEVEGDGGFLAAQDDPDDATGSLHKVCIRPLEKSAPQPGIDLTHSQDAADITWIITPTPGSSATVSPGPGAGNAGPTGGTKVAGPNDEPCVQWRSGGTGGQEIWAIWDNGVADPVLIRANIPPTAPLIKQWNDLDETKIVAVSGNVGDTLAANTDGLADWSKRDATFWTQADLDGTTIQVGGSLFDPTGKLFASGRSFLDYTLGDHANYSGPVDGALQTYSVSGTCGSVRLEDPTNGSVITLSPGQSAHVRSSDKGVGFQILPTSDGSTTTTIANADCAPGDTTTVTITTSEEVQLRSDLDTAPTETITIEWVVGPPTSKQPVLAWAGQRVLLEADWSAPDGTCPWPIGEFPGGFIVRYIKLTGPGGIVDTLGNSFQTGPDFVEVEVFGSPTDFDEDGVTDPNSDCISRVVYESEDQGEVDVIAVVVDPETGEAISGQRAFVVYYMKLEDVTLGIVPGSRTGHNSGAFTANTPPVKDPSNDVTSVTENVSADELLRVRVRGWFTAANCPVREASADSNGGLLPANRCIMPDDWEFLAGGSLAEQFRANMDIMKEPGVASTDCGAAEAGPFSLLDPTKVLITDPVSCTDSKAPHVNGGFRETVLDDDDVDMWDAPMPPALITLTLSGSGFLKGADKADVYSPTTNENPFYVTHIPSDPYIPPFNNDGTGYLWNTWGAGGNSGLYDFWTDLADVGNPIDGNGDGATDGWDMIRIYTDNHGEAMAWVNGDANLTFDDCDTSAAGTDPDLNIVLLNGVYCELDDVVGTSTITAVADYPDKRKHFPLQSDPVTVTWTWGGIKQVTIEPGESDQFNYVVLHITDRDGFCGNSPSLNPVLGETVEFLIDSPDGIIVPDADGVAAAMEVSVSPDLKSAVTQTFNTATNPTLAQATLVTGECQAWIHVSSSLLAQVNVLVTAHDPEGTVTFDVIINEPPTPPATTTRIWGDVDCDGDVDSVDALKILRNVAGLEVSQADGCPALGETTQVDGAEAVWGDVDCDGDADSVDALKILRHVAGLLVLQTEPCPDVGSTVQIPAS